MPCRDSTKLANALSPIVGTNKHMSAHLLTVVDRIACLSEYRYALFQLPEELENPMNMCPLQLSVSAILCGFVHFVWKSRKSGPKLSLSQSFKMTQ